MELFSTSFESSLSLPTPPPKGRRERGGEGKKEDREGEKKDGGDEKGKRTGLSMSQSAVSVHRVPHGLLPPHIAHFYFLFFAL